MVVVNLWLQGSGGVRGGGRLGTRDFFGGDRALLVRSVLSAVAHITASSPNKKISSEKTMGRTVIASSLSKKLKGRRQAIGRIWTTLNSRQIDLHVCRNFQIVESDLETARVRKSAPEESESIPG